MTYASEVLADSPVWWYRFGESSGSSAADDSGGSHTGTFSGTYTRGVAGLLSSDSNLASSFNGGKCTTPTGLLPTVRTLEAWIGPTSLSGSMLIIERYTGSDLQWQLYVSSDGRLSVWMQNASGTGSNTTSAAGVIAANTTYHVAATITSGGVLTLYVNGASVATATQGDLYRQGIATAAFSIGQLAGGGSSFVGTIDEAAAYSTALSAARLTAHYTAGLATPPSATMSAPSTMGVAATVSKTAAVALSAPATLTAGATATRPAAVAMSCPSTMTAATDTGVVASAAMTAPAVLTAAPDVTVPASVAMTAMATMSVALAIDHVAAAALSAPAEMTVGAEVLVEAAATMTAPSVLECSTGTYDAFVAMTAPSVLTATADVFLPFEPYTGDETGQAYVGLVAGGGIFTVEPAPAIAPDHIVERPIMRLSYVWDPPSLTGRDGKPLFVNPPAPVKELIGVPHVWIDGQDVTYFRGGRTQIRDYDKSAPFGDATASVNFPNIHPWDEFGVGDLDWAYPNAPVEIGYATPGGDVRIRWAGNLASSEDSLVTTVEGGSITMACEGSLMQLKRQLHRVPIFQPTVDALSLVADELNTTISRRFGRIAAAVSGIPSRQRGSSQDTRLGFIQSLLATLWTEDGRQWSLLQTAIPRQYRLGLKPTAPAWTITCGARGVSHRLTPWDVNDAPNVLYGHGITPEGMWWAGWTFPHLSIYLMPPYPYASGSTVMTIGSTDAGTLTGDGVSLWQSRMNQLGYPVTVDGVFNTADARWCLRVQTDRGILEDGIVGPQTWATTFDEGAYAANLNDAYRRPLAYDPRVEPFLYAANGARLSSSDVPDNPVYEQGRDRNEDDTDYGAGVTWAQGVEDATLRLARNLQPRVTGEIVLEKWSSPHEGASIDMNHNEALTYRGYRGGNPVLTIAGVKVSPETGTVRLAVDSAARDAMTLAQIRRRNADAQQDPARRPGPVRSRSGLDLDVVSPWDGDAPTDAGRIGAQGGAGMPLYGGLWTARWIYIGGSGVIASIDLQTYGPATKFCLLLMGDDVTANQAAGNVGNPLTQSKPWMSAQAWLDDHNFVDGWGIQGQAAGFSPGSEADGDPVTGRLLVTSPVNFVPYQGGWIKGLFFSPVSTFIRGRLKPGIVQ